MKVMKSAIIKALLDAEPIKELQKLALTALRRAEVVPYSEGEQSTPYLPYGVAANGSPSVIQFTPSFTERRVIGIDSSCIVVGEVDSSLLLVLKACVALIDKGARVSYHVLGPLFFPMTEEVVRDISRYVKGDKLTLKLARVDAAYAKSFVISFVEGTLLSEVAGIAGDALILLDGPLPLLRKVKHSAVLPSVRAVLSQGGDVLAISKTTRLFVMFSHLASLLAAAKPPAAVKLPLKKHFIMFVVLSRGGVTIRVDFPPGYTHGRAIQALEDLSSSDVGHCGYPDSLRLAHVYSKLSYAERVATLAKLRRLGVTIVPSQKRRDAIFGPFNRQWVTRHATV